MFPIVAVRQFAEAIFQRIIHFIRAELASFVWLAVLLAFFWLLGGWELRGRRLVLWCLVPVLVAVALIGLVGPDRLFPKKPYEGPSLIIVSENHALTLLDLPALAAALIAGLLACWLLRVRWRERARPRRRAARWLAPR